VSLLPERGAGRRAALRVLHLRARRRVANSRTPRRDVSWTTPSERGTLVSMAARPCPSGGRAWGAGVACQFCDQVEGLPNGVHLSSPARRLGGYLLEGVLAVVTLGVGHLVWSLIVYARGQTPGKQVLKMRVVSLRRGVRATWARMFLREWIAKPVGGILCALTLGIRYFWLIWDGPNQDLWDKIAGTIVVNDPQAAARGECRRAAPARGCAGTSATGPSSRRTRGTPRRARARRAGCRRASRRARARARRAASAATSGGPTSA
jgi:hypothetical protein